MKKSSCLVSAERRPQAGSVQQTAYASVAPEKTLQCKRLFGKQPEDESVPAFAQEALRSTGQHLDPETRSSMEVRFGHDFSRVRVHTNAQAAESARSIGARAYTVGTDIVFAADHYTAASPEGARLLAHELTHVIQQSNRGIGGDSETNANRAADLALAGATIDAARVGGTTLSLQKADDATATSTDAAIPDAGALQAGAADAGSLDAGTKQPPPSKKVCLTFDDGPENGTVDVLDVLNGRATATFFLTAKNMDARPVLQKALVERMLKEGHAIGNHTYTHEPEIEEPTPDAGIAPTDAGPASEGGLSSGAGVAPPQAGPAKKKVYAESASKAAYWTAYGDLTDPEKLKKFQQNYIRNEEYFEKLLSKPEVFKLARLPGDGRFVEVGRLPILIKATKDMGMTHVGWEFEFAPNKVFAWVPFNDWQGLKGVAASSPKFPADDNTVLFHDRHWSGKKTLFSDLLTTLEKNSFHFGKLDDAGKCS